MISIFYLQHINAYMCLLAKRIQFGIDINPNVGVFALLDSYFFLSINNELVCILKSFLFHISNIMFYWYYTDSTGKYLEGWPSQLWRGGTWSCHEPTCFKGWQFGSIRDGREAWVGWALVECWPCKWLSDISHYHNLMLFKCWPWSVDLNYAFI